MPVFSWSRNTTLLLFVLVLGVPLAATATGAPGPAHVASRSVPTSSPAVREIRATRDVRKACGSSGGARLCLVVPAGHLKGDRRITATWAGTGTARVEFELSGDYLNYEYAAPYSFRWPTAKERDGVYRLAARVHRAGRDGQWVRLRVRLANGNTRRVPRSPRDYAELFDPQPGGVLAAVGNAGAEKPAEKELLSYIESTRPAALLYLGEVHEFGTWATRLDHYGRASFDARRGEGTLWGRMARYTLATPGNHERDHIREFRDYWHWRPLWSSTVVDGIRIYDLSSECAHHGGCGAAGDQATWLAARLAQHTERCTVAMWQRPLVSVDKKRSSERMLPAWRLLAERGGDLVLTADTRDIEEVRPMDADLKVGRPGSHMVQLVSGAAAARWVSDATGDSRVAWRRYRVPGAVFVHRDRETLRWEFRDSDGQVLRTGSVPCAPPPQ